MNIFLGGQYQKKQHFKLTSSQRSATLPQHVTASRVIAFFQLSKQ
jgi:hypothetical protein